MRVLRWLVVSVGVGLLGAVIGLIGAFGPASGAGLLQPDPTRMAAPGPPCALVEWMPYVYPLTTCGEVVYDNVTPPEAAPALAGLAFAPDGTLYMVRTAFGELWALPDVDGGPVTGEPVRVAEGLRLPTSVAVHDGALYVATVDGAFRLDDEDGDGIFETLTLLISLDVRTGFWPGGIGVGPDERLYLGIGAACETCPTDGWRGVILSTDLDGDDARLEAVGVRSPVDFDWHPITGEMWFLDAGRVVGEGETFRPPDELNRLLSGASYGFPECVGLGTPDPALASGDDACANALPAVVTFPYQSIPGGLAFYDADGFPFWEGDLLVALSGSATGTGLAGYAVQVVGFDDTQPDGSHLDPPFNRVAPAGEDPYLAQPLEEFSLAGRGFYPYHPVDVVVSPAGWIYVSLAEGRVYRFRPYPAAGNAR